MVVDAATLIAAPPAPNAVMIPAVTYSCQSELTWADPRVPAPSRIAPATKTPLGPHRSAKRPTTGPIAP